MDAQSLDEIVWYETRKLKPATGSDAEMELLQVAVAALARAADGAGFRCARLPSLSDKEEFRLAEAMTQHIEASGTSEFHGQPLPARAALWELVGDSPKSTQGEQAPSWLAEAKTQLLGRYVDRNGVATRQYGLYGSAIPAPEGETAFVSSLTRTGLRRSRKTWRQWIARVVGYGTAAIFILCAAAIMSVGGVVGDAVDILNGVKTGENQALRAQMEASPCKGDGNDSILCAARPGAAAATPVANCPDLLASLAAARQAPQPAANVDEARAAAAARRAARWSDGGVADERFCVQAWRRALQLARDNHENIVSRQYLELVAMRGDLPSPTISFAAPMLVMMVALVALAGALGYGSVGTV
ncbi:hypothetical protein MPC4_370006 [Methylocella tundrae]|uniref:Transmembrane protein n=1 Tax=Methylocella tundrae TaxID=227605 RepID=A0A8B6M958_METTU|nr:hypothetical protein [Methylocella tundrae]VTZ26025.1 hypothetical protein MPC1_2760003 [Methylocella tundrae]VTZ51362.1 hypothetical protein MPC4_370006 [Methylocella tundrae]